MRVLGIDYGRRRIGLALSDATALLARPWKSMARVGNPGQVARALADEVKALQSEGDGLDAVVLGLPRRLSGEEHDLTRTVRAIAESLGALSGVPVILQDERLSSREAEQLLARAEKDWRKRKPRLDAAAAAVILQDYLDALPRPVLPADNDPRKDETA